MGKAKPMQLPSERNYQYEEWRPSDTPDIQAMREMPTAPQTLAPAIGAQYDRAQELSRQRWNNAYGGGVPEQARQALQQREQRGLQQDYGALTSQNAYDANMANFARRMQLAEMTLGRPLNSRMTGYDSAPTQSIWGDIIKTGAQVAGAAAAAGV
jgi:hypothetical protein